MAYTWVTDAHEPLPQPTAFRYSTCCLQRQHEVTRPKAMSKPTLPKKYGGWGSHQVPTYLCQSLHLCLYYHLQSFISVIGSCLGHLVNASKREFSILHFEEFLSRKKVFDWENNFTFRETWTMASTERRTDIRDEYYKTVLTVKAMAS